MATKLETKAAELYEADFYVWAERQAELLRARRFDELDLTNLIEEVEDLGGALKRSVLNNAAVVVEHLLKLEHSPAVDPRNGWRASIREHRRRPELGLRLERHRTDHVQGVGLAALRTAPVRAQQHLAGLGQRADLDLGPAEIAAQCQRHAASIACRRADARVQAPRPRQWAVSRWGGCAPRPGGIRRWRDTRA